MPGFQESRVWAARTLMFLPLFLLSMSTPLAADEGHWYAGVTAGPASHRELCSKAEAVVALTSCDDESVAAQVLVGRNFGNSWAAELAYIDAGDATAHGAGGKMTVSPRFVTAGAVYSLRVGGGLSLFLKGGLVAYSTDIEYTGNFASATGFAKKEQTGIEQTIGGGFEWDATRKFVLRLEYGHYNIDDVEFGDIDMLTAGLRLKF